LHQRDRFEIYGFSWDEADRSGLRARIVPQMDHHIRLTVMSDLQAAQTIRAHEIDILVDLHGLGADGRPGILARRAAPVQISWLGHPGSSAMPAVDYLLADAFVLPPELSSTFIERPLYLPDCVQLHDRNRTSEPLGPTPSRASCGLPQDGFIFCSFSSSRKLAPAQFAVWMGILKRVPASVLWLAADSETVRMKTGRRACGAGWPTTAARRRCSTARSWCATWNSSTCKWRAAPCCKTAAAACRRPACRWSAS
jgi:predicted O-linked N-acetylglucosamine transferase (SPINDLY family)